MDYSRNLAFNSPMVALSRTLSEKRLAVIFVFIIFAQNPPWPIWEFQSTLVSMSVIFGLLLVMKRKFYYVNGGFLGLFSIVGGFLYFFLVHGLIGTFRLSSAVFVLTLCLIFSSDTRTGALAFDRISRVFAMMLLVSLIFWALWQLGVSLPSTSMSYGSWKGDDGTTQLKNYYFFISEGQTLINRFYGVFDEPGVVGTLAALVLCGLRFNFNLKRTWIIAAGGLFSWSLAFIMLSLFGFFIFGRRRNIKVIAGIVLVILGLILIIVSRNILPSDDSASLILIYRIVNFSEYGISSRTDDALNEFFVNYIGSLDFIFGRGTAFFQKHSDLLSGQGAKFYLIEYGLMGMTLLLITYMAVIHSRIYVRNEGYLLLAVFLLSFLQRPHLMTPWQLVLFWVILCAWTEDHKGRNMHSVSN